MFSEIRRIVIDAQLSETKEALKTAFEELMKDVEYNLSSKNRDRFTQNLSTFKRTINGHSLLPFTLDPSMWTRK